MDIAGLPGQVDPHLMFDQAEQRYEKALEAAHRTGDVGLQGAILQHLGALAEMRGAHELAVTRFTDAIARFRTSEDRAAMMQTADLLGSAEKALDHYDAARTWYAEAERLARELGDDEQLAIVSHNLGILAQRQAQALPAEAREERARLLGEAAASVRASLALEQKRGNAEGTGSSYFQLSVIHRLLGKLNEAERYAREALAFYEPSDLPEVAKVYGSLELIAEARNRSAEAASWRAKKEARLAKGESPAPSAGAGDAQAPAQNLPPGVLAGFLGLCQALQAARSVGQPIAPELAQTIAQLVAKPDPIGAAGRFLQGIADGAFPDPPPGQPPELEQMFTDLLGAVRALPTAAAPAAPAPAVDAEMVCPCGSGRPFLSCHGAEGADAS